MIVTKKAMSRRTFLRGSHAVLALPLLIPVIIILALCFFKLRENFFKSYVMVRKSFQLLFWVFIIAGLSFYVKEQFNLDHFLLCAVPASIFFFTAAFLPAEVLKSDVMNSFLSIVWLSVISYQ